ncbi:MAG: hypothetical protein KDI13_07565 [Alphaproteobacteria bacterium]|nr:hypothetical protein [Alphaproteobacteria bacterium]
MGKQGAILRLKFDSFADIPMGAKAPDVVEESCLLAGDCIFWANRKMASVDKLQEQLGFVASFFDARAASHDGYSEFSASCRDLLSKRGGREALRGKLMEASRKLADLAVCAGAGREAVEELIVDSVTCRQYNSRFQFIEGDIDYLPRESAPA